MPSPISRHVAVAGLLVACTAPAAASDLPFDIDCHLVPANAKKGEPEHYHIDFRYLMRPVAAAGEPELPTACIPFGYLGEVSPSLARLARKMITVL